MTAVDLALLQQELTEAGVPTPYGLGTLDNSLETVHTHTAAGEAARLPPAADPVLAAHDASKPERSAAFETDADAERLRIVNERARIDPAFAALADLALRKERP